MPSFGQGYSKRIIVVIVIFNLFCKPRKHSAMLLKLILVLSGVSKSFGKHAKLVRNEVINFDHEEKGGKNWLSSLIPQSDMAVSWTEPNQWQDSVTNEFPQLARLLIGSDTYGSQFRKNYLQKQERIDVILEKLHTGLLAPHYFHCWHDTKP